MDPKSAPDWYITPILRQSEEDEYLPALHIERDVVQNHRAGISGVDVFEFYY